jgi:DNA-binding IclR family transcriptional regulator
MVDDDAEDFGVREIAHKVTMPPSSASRLLQLLKEGDLVEQDGGGRYKLGAEFLRLARRSTARHSITELALPSLRQLALTVDETALLGLYDSRRMEMLFAASFESSHPLRYVVELNRWMPVHCGASGLGIVAFLPKAEQEAIIEQTGLARITDRTITDASALRQMLKTTYRQGYACTLGQRISGAVGIGAPIFGPHDRVVGDVVITMPEQRFKRSSECHLAEAVKAAAAKITDELGGSALRHLPD